MRMVLTMARMSFKPLAFLSQTLCFSSTLLELTQSLKKLTKTLGLPGFVIFHLPKHDEELDSLFEERHVAIGNLGFHREGLRAAAAIRTSEYCLREYSVIDFMRKFQQMKTRLTYGKFCISVIK